MRKFTEITWPTEYSELKRIEELLVCGICYDYMETSVMTPCSHNYCSLCIRKYLHYKNQCPACFQDTFEKDLHTNRILDEIILYFSQIRDKLVTCISGAKRLSIDDNPPLKPLTSPPVRPARSNHIKSPEILTKPETPSDEPIISPVKSFSSPSTSGTSKLTSFFTPKSRKTDSHVKLVPCPVCMVEISELHINKHLDDCLKRDSMPERPPRLESKRKPLAKLVFCLMKDTELKKKMKLLNLSIRGDRKTLENRYHRYCTLYNAECDKVSPRSVDEVLKQCEEEEELERMAQEAKLNESRLNITRNTNQNVIEAMQKQYLECNKDKYEDLIEQIKSRKRPKPPVRRSLINENPSDNDNCNGNGNSNMSQNETSPEENWTSRPIFEDAFQDNDSSDSCLLQTYTSDHPISFLALGMGDDSTSPKKIDKRHEVLSIDNSRVENTETVESVSIYDQITDAETEEETDDEEIVKKSKGCMKRAKLNLVGSSEEEEEEEERRISEERESKAKKLAMAIAQDFCDDDSNDGEKADGKIGESVIVDKENDEGDGMSIAARRPVRKRNHPSRFSCQSEEERKGPQASRLGPIEGLREEINGNKPLSPKGNDGTMKRRRRRKCVTPSEEQTPPRRPIRKRDASNVLQNSSN